MKVTSMAEVNLENLGLLPQVTNLYLKLETSYKKVFETKKMRTWILGPRYFMTHCQILSPFEDIQIFHSRNLGSRPFLTYFTSVIEATFIFAYSKVAQVILA